MLTPDEVADRLDGIAQLWLTDDESKEREKYKNWLVETLTAMQIYLDAFDRNS